MLYRKLTDFIKRKPQLFCTPGHKGKMPRFFARLDVTELSATDNLYNCAGMIKEAQVRAAEIFGAKELLFLTSGSTQGIFAMLAAFKNCRVMVPREAHKSVFEACQTFNIEPVFEAGGEGVSARLITYPDYYGNTIDLSAIYEDCKKRGIYLLVDAAHASHFGFSQRLPKSAVPYCDVCVMSAHKTLPALTQGAYLAINSPALKDAVKNAYRSMGTTSPSFPIMASLDYAANYLKTQGEKNYDRLFCALQKFQTQIPEKIKIVPSADFTRLVLNFCKTGSSGFYAERVLNGAGVFPEFSDFSCVIFILSVCDTPAALRRLAAVLRRLDFAGGKDFVFPPSLPAPRRALPFLEAGAAQRECLEISAACGRVAAAEIGFYPPATPLVLRGEMITEKICDIIKGYKNKLFGLSDGKISVVKQ